MMGLRPETLRLRAEAAEDYAVVAACLQDALMPLREMAYVPGESRFVAVFDRFMWEHCGGEGCVGRPPFVIQSALRLEHVRAVRLRDIDQADKRQVLELLTLAPADGGAVHLTFAGGGVIEISGEAPVCLLEDIGEPEPTPLAPAHVGSPAALEEGGR
jgi:hypothetical protein